MNKMYTASQVILAFEAHQILVGQIEVHEGQQKKWAENLDLDDIQKAILDISPDIEEVWGHFSDTEKANLGRDVFLTHLVGCYIDYSNETTLELCSEHIDVANNIKENFDMSVETAAIRPS